MTVEQYASRHEAVALPWIDSPFFPTLLSQCELPADLQRMVSDFARDGFVVVDPQIPSSVLDSAVADLRDRFGSPTQSYYADDRRIQDAWNLSENVRRVAAAPRVLELLSILYRRPAIPFQTLNFRKGSEQRTHSDAAFFDSIPRGFMCGVWVALENVDEYNGPLRYYPGSHRLPPYNLSDLGVVASAQSHDLENLSRYEDFVEALMAQSPFEEKRLRVEKGQALIWASNLYHGGSPILEAGRTRHSQVTHYYFGGCMYYTPLTSDPAIGRLAVRQVFNAESGRMVPQYYQGRTIENPGEWPPRLGEHAGITDAMQYPTRVPRSAAAAFMKSFDFFFRGSGR